MELSYQQNGLMFGNRLIGKPMVFPDPGFRTTRSTSSTTARPTIWWTVPTQQIFSARRCLAADSLAQSSAFQHGDGSGGIKHDTCPMSI